MRTFRWLNLGLWTATVLSLAGCNFGGSGGGNEQAQIRMLNVSSGYDSLDLYTNNEDEDNDSDNKMISTVAYKTVSNYTSLASDTYTVKFKKAGATSTLYTVSGDKLTDESHATYVGYGSNGNFAALKISEDVTAPDSGSAKLNLLNVAEAGSLDVYLTDDNTALADATPTFSAVGAGTAATITTLDSGTYRLRVTGAGDTTDLRLDVPSVTLNSTQVAAIILTATSGGVLVNAVLLPQQGSVTAYDNTKARVRAAVGVASGLVTVGFDGTTVLGNSGPGVISAKYTQIEAGATNVSLTVAGSPVSVSSPTLTAGSDYTLLIYTDSAGATQANLISDDNHLPTNSNLTKVRLLNGMSGNGTAATLYLDFSPIVEGIDLGAASDYTEVDAGTDIQVDVNETSTNNPLFSRTGVTISANSVYTVFISGGGTGSVNGTVRKDR